MTFATTYNRFLTFETVGMIDAYQVVAMISTQLNKPIKLGKDWRTLRLCTEVIAVLYGCVSLLPLILEIV